MKKSLLIIIIATMIFAGCSEKPASDNKLADKQERRIIGVATYVDHIVLNTIRDSFINELQSLGYSKDKGWDIVVKSANGQANEAVLVAEELLNMNPSIIISISTPSTKPLFDKNNGRIPHVYSFVSFPKSIGIDESSKNTTGLSDGVDFVSSFNLIKEIIPNVKRMGMVYSDEPNAVVSKDEMLRICKKNNIEFIGQAISKEDEVKSAAQDLARKKVDVFFIGADSLVVAQAQAMVEVSQATKIPIFATDEGSIELGGLAALSVNYNKFGKETALVTDKVLKAGSANGITQVKYLGKDLAINKKTAQNLKITIPEKLINNAYKVF